MSEVGEGQRSEVRSRRSAKEARSMGERQRSEGGVWGIEKRMTNNEQGNNEFRRIGRHLILRVS